MIEELSGLNAYKKALYLKGDERIYIKADKTLCTQLEYVIYKQTSLENIFQSYINSTIEEANQVNFQKLEDRAYELLKEREGLILRIALPLLGQELLSYLLDQHTNHSFYVDYTLARLVIYNSAEGAGFNTCGL